MPKINYIALVEEKDSTFHLFKNCCQYDIELIRRLINSIENVEIFIVCNKQNYKYYKEKYESDFVHIFYFDDEDYSIENIYAQIKYVYGDFTKITSKETLNNYLTENNI